MPQAPQSVPRNLLTMMNRRQALVTGTAALIPLGAASNSVLPETIRRLRPSVCAIGSFNALDSPRFGFRGTGFVVGDGSLVATCWHVVSEIGQDSTKSGITSVAVQMALPDGRLELRPADVVASERLYDLALLRLKSARGPAVELAPDDAIVEGQDIALMGFPIGGVLGFKHVTHRGIVASVVMSSLPTASSRQLNDSAVSRLRAGSFELLQLDATAYPGNSGGPVFDASSGKVLGVVNMVLVKGSRESALSQPTGITYAVPVKYLLELMRKA